MTQIKLTNEVLAAALTGFEMQRDRILARIAEIKSLLGSGSEAGQPRKKRSAAVRRKMRLAQQLRWEKIRNAGAGDAKPKRTMSAAARKRIAAAQKKRWDAKKAESHAA